MSSGIRSSSTGWAWTWACPEGGSWLMISLASPGPSSVKGSGISTGAQGLLRPWHRKKTDGPGAGSITSTATPTTGSTGYIIRVLLPIL